MKDYYCEHRRGARRQRLPARCSPTSSASRATTTGPATRSTTPSARATRSSPRSSWPAPTPRCRTAARSSSRASARRSSAPTARCCAGSRRKVAGPRAGDPGVAATTSTRRCWARPRSARWPGGWAASRSTRCTSASKTGSAEVHGKQSTSWVASYDENYVVVMMVTQAGTGSGTSGPGGPRDLGGAVRRPRHARRPDAGRDPGHRAAARAADLHPTTARSCPPRGGRR